MLFGLAYWFLPTALAGIIALGLALAAFSRSGDIRVPTKTLGF